VHAGDALVFDFGQSGQRRRIRPAIVGNLPYNISTPLLFHLPGFAHCVRDMHFMLQKEVVERMVARTRERRVRAPVGDAAIPLRHGPAARCAAGGVQSRRPGCTRQWSA
jgi:hypothetical protein